MKDVVPTIMLFVPSVDGITHNEAEYTTDDDMVDGVRLLAEVLRRVTAGEFVEA
jgi:N-carbamoyl-L-amino-acid hydrolase